MKLIIVLALLTLNIAFAQTTAESISLIRPVQGDFITFMRSNPAWSWGWFKDHLKSEEESFAELARILGVVGGDVKPDNVDLTLTSPTSAEMVIVDLDDAGRGSFLGDIFHTLAYNEIWPVSIELEEAFDFYVKGLKSSSTLKDTYRLIDFNSYNREKEKLEKKKIRMLDSEEFFIKNLGLIPPHAIPSHLIPSYEYALHKISSYGVILRSGLKLKESGGSMGNERFTFLLTSERGLEIFEVKHQSSAAVSAYAPQLLSHEQRINEVLEIYRPLNSQGSFREVVKTPRGCSIVRTKEVELFDSSHFNMDHKIYHEYIRTMFFWLGQNHGKQNSQYVSLLKTKQKEVLNALKVLVKKHLEESSNHHKTHVSNVPVLTSPARP